MAAPSAPTGTGTGASSKRPAVAGSSVYRHDDVPLLVTVVGGNAVTAAAVLGCLNTADATALRRLHPALAAHVAAVPWADTTTGVRDTVRWRAALPVAVACKLSRYGVRFELAALRGVTVLDMNQYSYVTDADVAALPRTLRRLNVSYCGRLTQTVSFMHMPALEALDCSGTKSTLTCLPPSLRELVFTSRATHDFSHMHSLRVLGCYDLYDARSIASLPSSLEELELCAVKREWPHDWSAAHLARLRVLRAHEGGIHNAALATLPPSLQVLDLQDCHELKEGASFAHLTNLHTLNLLRAGVCNGMLGTLPPSLVSLILENAHYGYRYGKLTQAAVFPQLLALRMLNVSNTGIGDAAVASLPRGLEELHMVDCVNVTQDASLDHLVVLRVLQSSGTDLPRATIEACRSRGGFAPADGILCKKPSIGSVTAAALLASGCLVSCTSDGSIALWDASRGGDAVAKLELRDIRLQCSALAVLPDGHRAAIGMASITGGGGGIIMWDTSSAPRAPHQASRLSIDCGAGVCKLAVLRNGHLLAGCKNGSVLVVDVGEAAVVATLGQRTGTGTTAMRPWSPPELPVHHTEVQALAVLLGGRVASTASGSDCRVWVWDMGRRVCVDRMVGHTDTVAALAALPDGRLASGSCDRTVRLWDTRSRSSATCISLFAGYSVSAMAVWSGGRLACAAWDGRLAVWDTRNATRAPPPPVVTALESLRTSTLVSLPDGRLVTRAGGLRLWQLPPVLCRRHRCTAGDIAS